MTTDNDVSALDRANDAHDSAGSATLADNVPAQAIMAEFVTSYDAAAPRSGLAKLFGVTPMTADNRRLYEGVLGELEVGAMLDSLGSDWIVLHALPVAGGIDIDHLAIGPGGIYIITTRNHSGEPVWASQRTLLVGDIRYPDIRNMEYEMGRVERLLGTAAGRDIEVSGVLAVVSPRTLTVRQKHRDVEVLASHTLAGWLRGRRRVLAPADVTDVARAAADITTWHQDGLPPVNAVCQRSRFDQIRLEIVRAWRLRVTLGTVASVIGAGSFLAVTYVILLSALGLLPR